MQKTTLMTLLMILSPTLAFADSVFSTVGLPTPGSGVTIVPTASMNLPNATPEIASASYPQENTKDYSESESSYPSFLLKMGKHGATDLSENTDPEDTHMKRSASQIQLAFHLNPLIEPNLIPAKDMLGYAAGGLYLKDRGWSQISAFFNAKEIGTCKYTLGNFKITNGAIQISAEHVRYDINKKPTDIFVTGSINSGFIYSVSWFDDTYQHTLECANMNDDKAITQRMIELSRKIDSRA